MLWISIVLLPIWIRIRSRLSILMLFRSRSGIRIRLLTQVYTWWTIWETFWLLFTAAPVYVFFYLSRQRHTHRCKNFLYFGQYFETFRKKVKTSFTFGWNGYGSVKMVSIRPRIHNSARNFWKSAHLATVFRIHDILVWIRIRGSMPLNNGSGCGSFYFHHWPSRCQQKTNF